jgi:hypothetical protein
MRLRKAEVSSSIKLAASMAGGSANPEPLNPEPLNGYL